MGYVTKVNKQLTKFRVWKIDIFSYFWVLLIGRKGRKVFEIDTSDQMVIPTLRLAIHCIAGSVVESLQLHLINKEMVVVFSLSWELSQTRKKSRGRKGHQVAHKPLILKWRLTSLQILQKDNFQSREC